MMSVASLLSSPHRVWAVAAVTYGALMLVSATNVVDPMVRSDDFPALLGLPDQFYTKTLSEGRWVNYWWHQRGFLWPAWLNFALYQFFGALFAAGVAVTVCNKKTHSGYVIALALLVAISPPAFFITFWFNTLIPASALLALFAVLACYLPAGTMRWLLLPFVPLTLMAYTTYPFSLLAICLMADGVVRSWRDLAFTLSVFIAAFTLGMLLIYTLNYAEHGVFGLQMAEWRKPQQVVDWLSLRRNFVQYELALKSAGKMLSLHVPYFILIHILAFWSALYYLSKVEKWLTIYWIFGIGIGMGLLTLQSIGSGVWLPARTIGFVWVFYVILCVKFALYGQKVGGLAARISRNAIFFFVGIYFMLTASIYFPFAQLQSSTRSLAETVGTKGAAIYIVGDYKVFNLGERAVIQHTYGLSYRLTYLTGRPAFVCEEFTERCAEAIADDELAEPTDETQIIQRGDDTIVVLPKAAPSQ